MERILHYTFQTFFRPLTNIEHFYGRNYPNSDDLLVLPSTQKMKRIIHDKKETI